MIPKNVIDDITNRADIVSLIGERLQLSKKGRNWWAICPFHQDSTPSLSVSPEKKLYKCFSCQVSGNVIEFIKNFDHINFYEAINKIASSINYDLSQYQNLSINNNNHDVDKIFAINHTAMSFFKSVLVTSEGKKALEYLKSRHIGISQIDKFDIGFIASKNNLVQHLLDKGFTAKEIIDAGLGYYKETNKQLANVFADRVMFAIKDVDNRIIGFSGRKMETDSERPKYLNTKETVHFAKRKIAYNFFDAVKVARIQKELIVLEGYMDVISMDRVGIHNVICLMGTSLSAFHINLLKKLPNCEIKLFLDGDLPGVNAAIKASATLLANQLNTSIVDNQTTKDPDELINDGQVEYLKSIIAKSIDPLAYVLNHKRTMLQHDKVSSVTDFIYTVADFAWATHNEVIVQKASAALIEICQLEKVVINKLIMERKKRDLHDRAQPTKPHPSTPIVRKDANTLMQKAKAYEASELAIVEAILKSRKNIEYIQTKMYQTPLTNVSYRRLINQAIVLYKADASLDPKGLITKLHATNSPELNQLLDEIVQSLSFEWNVTNPEKRLDDAFDKLKERDNEKDILEYEQLINDHNTSREERQKFQSLLEQKIRKRELWKQKFSNKEKGN